MKFNFKLLGKLITTATKGKSVREAAKIFGVSSATFHRASKGKTLDVNILIIFLRRLQIKFDTLVE